MKFISVLRLSFIFLLILAARNNDLTAQIIVTGRIMDDASKKPLAFANASLKADPSIGTISDVDGNFRLLVNTSLSEIIIELSFVGYQKQSVVIHQSADLGVIALKEEVSHLAEITVMGSDKNPAIEIIEKVVQNAGINNPEEYSFYQYRAYNKTAFTFVDSHGDSMSEKKQDSIFQNAHLFLSESYTAVKFKKPGRRNETVLANKLSGIEKSAVAMLSTTFQPFSFYSNYVTLFETQYLNPINKNSEHQYEFAIQDTLLYDSDTTYIISYIPKKKKVFHALEGLIYISTRGYAIQNVIASSADTNAVTTFRIQQKYSRIQDRWFPSQLSTQYWLKEMKFRERKILITNQTYITSVDLSTAPSSTEFPRADVELDLNSSRDSLFWKAVRYTPLTTKDHNTYKMYDRLPEKIRKVMSAAINYPTYLAQGKLPVGLIDIMLPYVLRFNQYEKIRLGLGISTNDRISSAMSVEGYVGYGFGDKAIKYGGGIRIKPIKNNDLKFSLLYMQDVVESGLEVWPSVFSFTRSGEVFRKILIRRMDSVERYSFGVEMRPFRKTWMKIQMATEKRNPTFSSVNEGIFSGKHFQASIAEAAFQYVPHETIVHSNHHFLSTGQSYPIFQLLISKAFRSINSSTISFFKTSFKLEHRFITRNFGKADFYINAGKVWGKAIPYSYLYYSKGIKTDESVSLFLPGQFQTMKMYEFLSDRYISGGIIHNLGTLFSSNDGTFMPELVLIHNMMFGSLRDNNHLQNENTLEKGYYESGVVLNNLLRIKTNIYHLGYGMGGFFRYGPYAFSSPKENFALLLSVSITL